MKILLTLFLLSMVNLLAQVSSNTSMSSRVSISSGGRAPANLISSFSATAKGPNQINLTWGAAPSPGYGYTVEIQSGGDARYSSYTELQPIPTASGYTCNAALSYNGVTGCNISDGDGDYVYTPPVNGVPYWVTENQYIDPQDGTAAQFIAWGLKNNTAYNFRVRAYTGNTSPSYGPYSSTATVTTANYTQKYVSTTGDDNNTGNGIDRRAGMAAYQLCHQCDPVDLRHGNYRQGRHVLGGQH